MHQKVLKINIRPSYNSENTVYINPKKQKFIYVEVPDCGQLCDACSKWNQSNITGHFTDTWQVEPFY